MTKNIALLVNGLIDWYENIDQAFQENQKTWIQQTSVPPRSRLDQLKSLISQNGFFYTYGYAQNPIKKVIRRYKIIEIKHSNDRLPPPDNTAPSFSSLYDTKQGHCENENDYKYKMWLKVSETEKIVPMNITDFILDKSGKPLPRAPRHANYIINVPSEDVVVPRKDVSPTIYKEITKSTLDERNLQSLILQNIKDIEDGLKLHEANFRVERGYIDILCTDKDGNFVVIELKAGEAPYETYSQIKYYMAELRKSEIGKNKSVRGIIIAEEFDERLTVIINEDPSVKLRNYKIKVKF